MVFRILGLGCGVSSGEGRVQAASKPRFKNGYISLGLGVHLCFGCMVAVTGARPSSPQQCQS